MEQIRVDLILDGKVHTIRVDSDITPKELIAAASDRFKQRFADYETSLIDSFGLVDGARIEIRPRNASVKVDWGTAK